MGRLPRADEGQSTIRPGKSLLSCRFSGVRAPKLPSRHPCPPAMGSHCWICRELLCFYCSLPRSMARYQWQGPPWPGSPTRIHQWERLRLHPTAGLDSTDLGPAHSLPGQGTLPSALCRGQDAATGEREGVWLRLGDLIASRSWHLLHSLLGGR